MQLAKLLTAAAGRADVGYHGKAVGAAVRTPAIDELALAGVRLEQYYVVQLCSPTRTSLLSGRYPYNIGQSVLGSWAGVWRPFHLSLFLTAPRTVFTPRS